MLVSGFRATTSRTSCSLPVWLRIWCRVFLSPFVVMVMRDTRSSLVAETVRLSMLKPLRANRLEMRASTPALLSTSIETTCCLLSLMAVSSFPLSPK